MANLVAGKGGTNHVAPFFIACSRQPTKFCCTSNLLRPNILKFRLPTQLSQEYCLHSYSRKDF